ncbi:MAG: D-alanyl-D-alanine carboxypeptidase [Lachnospiraceae bacterium]|nr:D-alanyl-D-alanine carboxypeptidase [Lachnospiraceae bacterium]
MAPLFFPYASLTARADGRGPSVTAPDWPEGPELASDGAILIDVVTGTVLYEKNIDQRFYPASITKIMTALLAIEKLPLGDVITYTREDIYSLEKGASTIALRPGEELTVEESLYGLLLASGNECANGLARKAGGTIAAFVEMMNARAKEMGCTGTNFVNPHGLHDENHYTTPRDMAVIMRAAITNETYLRFDSTRTHIIPATNLVDEKRPVKMRHEMMDPYGKNYYEGVTAGKTGFTTPAGNTLVTYAVRDGVRLISVVMHSTGQQYEDTKKLLDYGFSSFQSVDASQWENRFSAADSADIMNIMMEDGRVDMEVTGDSWVVMPKTAAPEDLTTDIVWEAGADGSAGKIRYLYEGMEVGSASLRLKEGTEKRFPFAVREGLYIIEADGTQHLSIPHVVLMAAGFLLLLAAVIGILRRMSGKTEGVSFRTDRGKGHRS